MLERPSNKLPSIKEIYAGLNIHTVTNAFVAVLFSQTGPIAILISAAHLGGLTQQEMATWLFAGYGLGGIITILLSVLYKQPISAAWSLPAAAIVASSLQHSTFQEILGACLITGLVIIIIGLTGIAKKMMDFIPTSIVMGMVAGIFLPYCLKLVTALTIEPVLAASTIAVFFLTLAVRVPFLVMPPILCSALVGIVIIAISGILNPVPITISIVHPVFYIPVFSFNAIIELVLPLTISVIAIHNYQGIAILKSQGYNPPVNIMTLSCGVGSIAMGFFGSVPTCITGPVTGILNTSGPKETRYISGILYGALLFMTGIFAPVAIGLAIMAPDVFVVLLGGLALFNVLVDAFQKAFKDHFSSGALICFLITFSNLTFCNIGSAFWGLLTGCVISFMLHPQDFRKHQQVTVH